MCMVIYFILYLQELEERRRKSLHFCIFFLFLIHLRTNILLKLERTYFMYKNYVQKSERIATIFHPILIVLVHMCLIVVVLMLHLYIRCTIKMVIIIMYFLCFLSTNFCVFLVKMITMIITFELMLQIIHQLIAPTSLHKVTANYVRKW